MLGILKEDVMDNFNNESNMAEEVTSMVSPLDMSNTAAVEAEMTTPISNGEEVTQQQTGFKLANDNPVSQQVENVQPEISQGIPGMPQQTFGQSSMSQGIPGMPPQGMYGQPGANMNPGMNPGAYGQPAMNAGMNMAMNGQPNMYGQPGMNPGMPPQGGNVPKPKKQKKPLSKGAIGGIIGGGVALIALVVCAIIFLPKLFRSDKEVVVDAFENTFGVETNSADADDEFGMNAYYEEYNKNGGTTDIEVVVNSVAEDEAYAGTYLSTVATVDRQNKKMTSSVDFGTADGSIVNVLWNADETNTYIILKDMIDGTFVLPNDNAFIQLENSPFGEALELEGMPEINLADLYFPADSSGTAATAEVDGEIVSLVEDTWDSITYEKQGKAKVSVMGKKVTAKEYYVTLTEEKIEDLMLGFFDYAEKQALADPALLEESGLDSASLEAAMTQIETLIPQIIAGDLLVKVYVADDEIVKITCADEIGLYGVDIAYDFYLDMGDEGVEGKFDISVMDETFGVKFTATETGEDAVEGKATIYGGEETIDVNFNGTASDEKIDLYADVVANGTTLVKMNIDYALKDDNSYNGEVAFELYDDYSGETISAKGVFDGDLVVAKKGVSYIGTNNIVMYLNEEELFDVSIESTFDNSNNTVSGSLTQGTQYDIVSMVEDDLVTLIEDNQELIIDWAENVENNAGPFADLFSGMDDITTEPTEPAEPVDEPTVAKDTLIANGREVKIVDCIDGFEFYMSSDDGSWVAYETEEMSDISYYLFEGVNAEEAISYMYLYVPDDEYVLEKELNQTMTVGEDTIYYSYCIDNEWEYETASYCMVKEIEPNLCLAIHANIYLDDDPFTKEQIAEALNSKNYTIVK